MCSLYVDGAFSYSHGILLDYRLMSYGSFNWGDMNAIMDL